MVGRHNRGELGGAHGRFERGEVDFAQFAWQDACRRPVQAAVGRTVPHEVFAGRHDAVGPVVALQPADIGDAHARREIGVFAERLLRAPPTRVAGDVQHRRETIVDAHRAHLLTDDLCHRLDQFRLPGAGDPDDLREVGRAVGEEAAATLVMDQRRDAQPRLFDEKLLDGVGKVRRLYWAEAAAAGQARHLAQAVRQAFLCPLTI